MKYIYIQDYKVHEIIPEFNPIFPNIPIQQRYSKEFLDNCVIVDESVEVRTGMLYDPETQTFTDPPTPDPVEPPAEPGEVTPSEAEILRAQIKASSNRQEFLEDVIAEMAMVVYD